MDRNPETVALMAKLAEPFPDGKVKWKPQTVQGNRALALAYIDARTVQERLDEVLGPENWQSKFTKLDNGAVACELSVRIAGEWITKSDVGGESEQPDKGDRTKAAYSDALKRAAVQFGIGRHLYSLPKTWAEYDPVKRQFKTTPKLPRQPGGNPPARTAPAAQETKAASTTTQTPPGNPKQLPGAAEAKAEASPRAAQPQIERIDLLLGRLRKDAKWMKNALQEKFGKDEPCQLTAPQADQVIAGLESACKKAGIQLDEPAKAANTESGTKPAVQSAGSTPPRRGKF